MVKLAFCFLINPKESLLYCHAGERDEFPRQNKLDVRLIHGCALI